MGCALLLLRSHRASRAAVRHLFHSSRHGVPFAAIWISAIWISTPSRYLASGYLQHTTDIAASGYRCFSAPRGCRPCVHSPFCILRMHQDAPRGCILGIYVHAPLTSCASEGLRLRGRHNLSCSCSRPISHAFIFQTAHVLISSFEFACPHLPSSVPPMQRHNSG